MSRRTSRVKGMIGTAIFFFVGIDTRPHRLGWISAQLVTLHHNRLKALSYAIDAPKAESSSRMPCFTMLALLYLKRILNSRQRSRIQSPIRSDTHRTRVLEAQFAAVAVLAALWRDVVQKWQHRPMTGPLEARGLCFRPTWYCNHVLLLARCIASKLSWERRRTQDKINLIDYASWSRHHQDGSGAMRWHFEPHFMNLFCRRASASR